jgi:transposase-like protein
MSRPKRNPEELIQRGVRITLESERPIAHIAADLGIGSETLRKRVRQAEADSASARTHNEPRPSQVDADTSKHRPRRRYLRAQIGSRGRTPRLG